MISGGTPRAAKLTKRASGFRSNCLTARSLARISAAGAVAGLRAVAGGHAALGGEHRLQLGQAFERGVGARAFVDVDGARLDVDFTILQVGRNARPPDGVISSANSRGNGRQRTLVRLQRKGVLRLAADLPLRGHLLGRHAHAVGDAEVLVAREHLGVEGRLVAAHRHHAHALGAAGDHHVGLADADAVGRHLQRAQARGAEAVDRDAAHHRCGSPASTAAAGDVHALLALGEGAADDRVLDGLRVQRWAPAPARRIARTSRSSGRVLRK
jgi:hypothetical protein